jgi:hypothetical protein
VREGHGRLRSHGNIMLAKGEGNAMIDEDVTAKLKHFSAQVIPLAANPFSRI